MKREQAQYQLSHLRLFQSLVLLKMISYDWYATIMSELFKTLNKKNEPIPRIPEHIHKGTKLQDIVTFAHEQSQHKVWDKLYPKDIKSEQDRLMHWGAHPTQRTDLELSYYGYSTLKRTNIDSTRRNDFFLYFKGHEAKSKSAWARLIKKHRERFLALTQCTPLIMDLHQLNSCINMANECFEDTDKIRNVNMDEAYTSVPDAPKACRVIQNICYSFERDLLFKALKDGILSSEETTAAIGKRQTLWHTTTNNLFNSTFEVSNDFLRQQEKYQERNKTFAPKEFVGQSRLGGSFFK